MTLVRVLRTAQVVLSHTFYVDETATDATGSVTVSVKRLDGTVVTSGTASGPVSHAYTFTVPAQSQVDTLTVDWTGTVAGAAVTARDVIEVVGGFIFGLAEARAQPPALSLTKYTTAALAQKRIGVENECEEICGQAFVPRFNRALFTLGGVNAGPTKYTITLPHINVRTLRAVTVDGTTQSLTGLVVSESGVLTGLAIATTTVTGSKVIVEYEHGLEYPPEDLKDACMLRMRSRLAQGDSGIPQRALSFSVADGGVYRLSTPSGKKTGIPDVDGVYERYTLDRGGFA
jgi:hypothetical protein